MKRTAAVAELKAQLSRYLRWVKAGEEVLVTERGAPVARLVPVNAGERAKGEDYGDLERQGLMRVGSGRLPKGFWTLPRARDPRAVVRTAVSDERDGGW
jgi:prevent-host-death family protein